MMSEALEEDWVFAGDGRAVGEGVSVAVRGATVAVAVGASVSVGVLFGVLVGVGVSVGGMGVLVGGVAGEAVGGTTVAAATVGEGGWALHADTRNSALAKANSANKNLECFMLCPHF